MTQIQKLTGALMLAGMALSSTMATAQSKPDDERAVGSKLTIKTCVEKGLEPATFVTTRVTAVPPHAASHGRVVYWFDSGEMLSSHVGKMINIKGTITDVDSEELEVKSGPDGKGGWKVEMEGPGRNVYATPVQLNVSTAGRKSGENDIKTTVVTVKIDEVTVASQTCPARP